MTIFNRGNFHLSSGLNSSWKINCDELSNDDLVTLAHMACKIIPPFGAVEGVPTGGLRFAEIFFPFITEGPVLIVDDVFTTGKSITTLRNNREATGLVIFSRGILPYWVKAIFQTNVPL